MVEHWTQKQWIVRSSLLLLHINARLFVVVFGTTKCDIKVKELYQQEVVNLFRHKAD